MKKFLSIITVTCVLTSMLIVSAVSAGATGQLVINKKAKANVGDKVKYILYLADTDEEIEGFEMNLNFDPEYLETNNDSIKLLKIDSAMKNIVKGEVFLNWTNVFKKLNFSDKQEFLDIEFTVKKAGNTDITKFIKEIYGDDMTYLKSYTWTYDLVINDDTVIKDEPPLITTDEKLISQYQGSYINYVDGKGEKNSPEEGDHQAVTVDNNLLKNRDATQGNRVGETVTINQQGSYIQDVTRFVDKNNSSGGFPAWIIGAGAGVLILGLIVAAVVKKKKKQ